MALVMVVAGCANPIYRRTAMPCPPPPPPPQCLPLPHSPSSADAFSRERLRKAKLAPVLGAASAERGEWGFTSLTANYVLLLRGRSSDTTTYDVMRFTNVESVGASVAPSSFNNIMITHVRDSDIMGDASVAVATVAAGDAAARFDSTIADSISVPIIWDGHPAVFTYGNTTYMVFSSERPNAVTGTDLWWTVWNGRQWASPRHLGDVVNTPCDEITPFVTADATRLFFASAGHATMGGYDIFSAPLRIDNGNIVVGNPVNLGELVNGPKDEIAPWMPSSAQLPFYFSSDRVGTFDMYVVHEDSIAIDPVAPSKPVITSTVESLDTVPTATLTGTVLHEQTRQPVVDAEVTARDEQTDRVVSRTRTDTTGTYALDVPVGRDVEITAQSPDLFYDQTTINVPRDQARDTVRSERELALPLRFNLRVNFPTSIFDDPYEHTLDSNGVETTETWQDALRQVALNVQASGARLKKLVLIGHTDDVDTDANNLLLGERRVQFVMDRLVELGVDRSLLEGRSAGERLLPDKRRGEAVDQWRKRSRRVELVKVMER